MFLFFAMTAIATAADRGADDALNCRLDYAGLLTQMARQPGAHPEPVPADEPLGVYSVPAQRAVYTFTIAGQPAHPAFIQRRLIDGPQGPQLQMTACGFGDRTAFKALVARFRAIDEGSIARSTPSRRVARATIAAPEP